MSPIDFRFDLHPKPGPHRQDSYHANSPNPTAHLFLYRCHPHAAAPLPAAAVYHPPRPLELVRLLLGIAGVCLNLLADHTFHLAGTTVKPFQVSTSLVTRGVYRISRNPMYLGFSLILAGLAVGLGSLTPWIVLPFFIELIESWFIQPEEKMLADQFGSGWEEYSAQVPRWF